MSLARALEELEASRAAAQATLPASIAQETRHLRAAVHELLEHVREHESTPGDAAHPPF